MTFVVVGEYLHVCVCACAEKQVKIWDPLLDWFKSEIGVRPLVTSSIFGTTQPPEVLDAVEKAVRQCSDWQLAAVDWLAGTAHSLIVALAIARGRLGIEEAIEIIRLEEDHQACIYVWHANVFFLTQLFFLLY
jgi:ATP synthase F1 complex assembly factor 2